MTINNRLFTIMNEKNIKMSELARELGINKTVISAWKNRGTNPPIEYTVQICKLLNISIEYYITGKEKEQISQEEQKLLNAYRSADARGKKTIMRTAEAEAEQQDESSSCRTG